MAEFQSIDNSYLNKNKFYLNYKSLKWLFLAYLSSDIDCVGTTISATLASSPSPTNTAFYFYFLFLDLNIYLLNYYELCIFLIPLNLPKFHFQVQLHCVFTDISDYNTQIVFWTFNAVHSLHRTKVFIFLLFYSQHCTISENAGITNLGAVLHTM